MTDSTTIDSGKTGHKQRRASEKPPVAGVRSGFNPLHPSMELPPEQLIRLLGLESKKIRKSKRTHTTPAQKKTAPPINSLPTELERTEPAPKATPKPQTRSRHRQREYEHVKTRSASKHRRGLWVPALVVGLTCGIAVSVYLFWPQPGKDTAIQSPAPVVNKANPGPANKSRGKAPPVSTVKPKPATVVKDDAAWRSTIDAQAKRLQTKARQRFSQRLDQAPLATTLPAVAPQADIVIPAPLAPEEDSIDTTTPAAVTAEPADSALQTSEALNSEDINTSELIDRQESSPVIDQAHQPDDAVIPVPATESSADTAETLSRENISESF